MRLTPVFASAVFLAGVAMVPLGLQASAEPRDSEPRDRTSTGSAMVALVDVVARRVEIGDTVAAAKWGTTLPIDDPAREKVVLDAASAEAPGVGVDPALAVSVFSDQIAANKVVQYGLFARWTAHPDQAPATRADLTQVRPVLDQITHELLVQLQATHAVRVDRGCDRRLRAAQTQVERSHDFDRGHREALDRALVSICV